MGKFTIGVLELLHARKVLFLAKPYGKPRAKPRGVSPALLFNFSTTHQHDDQYWECITITL